MLLASLSFATSALGVSLRDPVVSELSRLGYGRVRGVTQLNSGGGERGLRTSHRRYDTDEGPVFCKTSPLACAAQAFEAEAASLRALRSATLGSGLVRMPKPIATGAMPLGGSFLALEWLDLAPLGTSFPSTLHAIGEAVADLHTAPQPPGASDAPWAARSLSFGFSRPTFLGAYPQPNGWERSFAEFFVLRRLLPQLEAACAIGGGSRTGGGAQWDGGGRAPDRPFAASPRPSRISGGPFGGARNSDVQFGISADASGLVELRRLRDRVMDAAEARLEKLARPPALLHGELWLGSFGALSDGGGPALFDPACWYGLPESDLALMEVRGRPGKAFYEAYHAAWPKEDGYAERLDLFVLYYRLVELNRLASAPEGEAWSAEGPGRGTGADADSALAAVVELMRRVARQGR